MLIPRFSLRWLLVLTAVCAVVALMASFGGRGVPWATGIAVAVGSLVLLMLVQALLFAGVWLATRLLESFRTRPFPPGGESGGTARRAGES